MLYMPALTKHETAPAISWQDRFQQLANAAHDPRLRDYYSKGMVAGDTPIAEAPLLAVDFETTGLDPTQHGIVSIAMIPMTIQRIALSQAKTWIVKPQRPLTSESVVIHGITHSDIAAADDIVDHLEDILAFAAGKIWVVHYRGIERPFFQRTLLNRIQESIDFPVIDTMQLEANCRRQPLTRWQQLLQMANLKQYRQPSIRLADSRERYGLPFYPPHNALTDTLACAELLQAQIAHHYSPTTPISQLWL